MKKRITIDDVAEESGISRTTVSYILNGKCANFQISAATIRKVAETAIRLNYQKEKAQNALDGLEQDRISVLVLSPWLYAQHSDFMAQLHPAFKAMEERFRFEFVYMQYHSGQLGKVLRPMIFARYDAVVITGTSDEDNAYLSRNREKLSRVILLNRRVEGILSVSGNDRQATYELGCRLCAGRQYDKVLIVSDQNSWCSQFRKEGMLQAAQEANLPVEVWELDAQAMTDQTLQQVEAFLGDRGLVFFTQYQPAAMLLIRQPQATPCRGIACYDEDKSIRRFLPRQLTTLDPYVTEMAKEAAQMAKRLKAGEQPESVVIPAGLIAGQTAELAE